MSIRWSLTPLALSASTVCLQGVERRAEHAVEFRGDQHVAFLEPGEQRAGDRPLGDGDGAGNATTTSSSIRPRISTEKIVEACGRAGSKRLRLYI
jgi:hypothetical protein